jgi:hypothetical protein
MAVLMVALMGEWMAVESAEWMVDVMEFLRAVLMVAGKAATKVECWAGSLDFVKVEKLEHMMVEYLAVNKVEV